MAGSGACVRSSAECTTDVKTGISLVSQVGRGGKVGEGNATGGG